jgi:hypothetical protein
MYRFHRIIDLWPHRIQVARSLPGFNKLSDEDLRVVLNQLLLAVEHLHVKEKGQGTVKSIS